MIGKTGGENLCLVLQPAESARMNHAVAIALKRVSIGMREFRIAAAQAVLDRKAEMRKRAARRLCGWPYMLG
jgi:hypothetical protein